MVAGRSRPKDSVLLHANVRAIHAFFSDPKQAVDARHNAGHDEVRLGG